MQENEWRKAWYIDKSIQQAQYMNKVNEAQLPPEVKDFCRYIASKATWRHTTKPDKSYYPCYATHDAIEYEMNRSRHFVSTSKKQALELGWIQVLHRPGTSDLIWPRIGIDDPTVKPKVRRESWGREDYKPVDE